MRGQETEVWPDGRALIYQPERLVRSLQIVHDYCDQFEGRGKYDPANDKTKPKGPDQPGGPESRPS